MQSRKTNTVTAPAPLTSKLGMNEALQGFKSHAMLASTALVDMVVSGTLVYIIGYLFVDEKARPKKDVIREKVDGILKAVNPTKATSTLAAYVTTAENLFRVMTDGEHKAQKVRLFQPVLADISKAGTIEAAQDVLASFLKGKGVTGLDKLKEFVGVAPSNGPSTRTVTEKATSAIKTAMTAVAAAVEDKRANVSPAQAATVIANAIPASVKPEVLMKASLSRIGNASEASKAAHDACLHLAHIDLDAFDSFVTKLVKTRDTMLSADTKPKATRKAKGKTAEAELKAS